MPTRRTLLRATGLAGVALAGCTAPGGSEGTETRTPSEVTPPAGSVGRVRVTRRDEPPDLPVEPRVAVTEPYVTGESTAVLRIDVDNTTGEPVTIGEYRAVVFQYVHSGATGYVLLSHSERSTDGVPARSPPDVETTGGADCWRLASGVAVTAEYGTVEIPENGTLTAFVGLYATHEASACLPTGEFGFTATYTVDPLSEKTPTERGSWGFTLAVEPL